ncbi:type I-MYXAN CRISPR-associated protein Cas6/Cmx6 [bacterium]|nr:type I-MYXAN CRISPR-associated protein Cas6/Cmx6 [bacterium]MCI0555935.1 type I-MYXAN CRISPR-associated protein Cas6/Cmx6 [Anaerolineae bacterium]MCI0604153.1 type I-MYXAN CRISPR-associated protein Cas6/Cmx6 [bacterium]
MILLEIKFPIFGTSLPSDHGYSVFASISRLIPQAHEGDWLAIDTMPGAVRGDGTILINGRARLRMRAPQNYVRLVLQLAGKRLDVSGHHIRLGIPQIFLLQASEALYARSVTIKKFTEPEPFLEAVKRKLDEMGIKGKPAIGARRAFRVGSHTIVGFGLTIRGLSAEHSLLLQERGIGGRRHMGCGYFVRIGSPMD